MDTLALSAKENADFALVRKFPAWVFPALQFGKGCFGQNPAAEFLPYEIRFEILASSNGALVETFSTANGRAWFSPRTQLLVIRAPRSVMAGRSGAYSHRCRVIWPGNDLTIFGGSLIIERAITRGAA